MLLPLDTMAARQTTPVSDAVAERMRNREKLLAQSKPRAAGVTPTPTQKTRGAEQQQAERARNRDILTLYANIAPGAELPVFSGAELMAEMTSPRVAASIHQVIRRLERQLGKPYVWGGQTPEQGFDCSGLVFYAFNHVLQRKLPRTANAMYRDRALPPIGQPQLRRGDLIFFSIKTPNAADHVGVYLGEGQFIEAPRTGKNIRISRLDNGYWQERYLGARRVLREEVLL